MMKEIIAIKEAPAAIGPYSQAVKVGDVVYLAGQIGIDPATGQLVEGFEAQADRVLKNILAVVVAAGGSLEEIVQLTVYLTDLSNYAKFNEIMAGFFAEPYPARAVVGVAALPRGALLEAVGIMDLTL